MRCLLSFWCLLFVLFSLLNKTQTSESLWPNAAYHAVTLSLSTICVYVCACSSPWVVSTGSSSSASPTTAVWEPQQPSTAPPFSSISQLRCWSSQASPASPSLSPHSHTHYVKRERQSLYAERRSILSTLPKPNEMAVLLNCVTLVHKYLFVRSFV